MIVCTADRPPELRDVGAPQTIDQTQLFGTAVRWFHDPGVPSFDASSSWRSLAARSVHIATGARPGPVHLNLPFREPLVGVVGDIPAPRATQWSSVHRLAPSGERSLAEVAAVLNERTGVIVAGKGAGRDVLLLAEALGWPIFADPVSGVREDNRSVVIGFDSILRCSSFEESHVPEVILRIGATPASKVLSQWVTRHGTRVVQLSATDMTSDPDHSVEMTVIGDIDAAVSVLASSVRPCAKSWREAWASAEEKTQETIDSWVSENFSEPSVARVVTSSMAVGTHLVVSSSMPIRDVEWYGTATAGVRVYSNRGTNGIDGVVSTAVGIALATRAPVTLLIGDVACIHDSNGLWALNRRDVDLTIVVTNNDGGSIFSFLPQASAVSDSTFELLYGTPHGVSFEHLASAHGIAYQRATTTEDLQQILRKGGTRLIEVPFDRSVNVSQHEALQAAVVTALDAMA
jgi:2-succinyl-5-enolpyruvyl-6-hydroxy-3-cyclohexene-1-carboxylate synthase